MPRAAIIPAAGKPIETVQFDTPHLETGSVLLETVYSEICGTDVHLQQGHLTGVPYPIIPGHVSVGRVAETAGEVRDTDRNVVSPGDLVTFLDVHGCWGSDFSHFYRAVQIVDRFNDRVSGGGWDQLVTHTYGLSELNEALQAVARGDTVKAVVDPRM